MESKRGRLEIARDILTMARSGTGITAIVYGANLNFPIAKKHIQEMEGAGLIQVEDVIQGKRKTRLYTTTGWGHEFMRSLERTLAMYERMTHPLRPEAPVQEVSEA